MEEGMELFYIGLASILFVTFFFIQNMVEHQLNQDLYLLEKQMNQERVISEVR